MNLATPSDNAAVRTAQSEDLARAVAGDGPVLLVDVERGALLAANAAATRALGLAPEAAAGFDRAMPAWSTIRAFLDGAGSGSDRRSPPLPLLLWTPAGPATASGVLDEVRLDGRSLVRITLAADAAPATAPTAAGDAAARPAAANGHAETQVGDMATLREIARRIRSGIAATPAAAADAAPTPPSGPPRRPPPLDFKPMPVAAAAPDRGTLPSTDVAPAFDQLPDAATRKLAHELRTPLSAIVSLAEIMRDERLGAMGNARYRSYAADIHDTARHTLDLVATLLDGDAGVAGADAAAAPRIELEAVDLNDIAARCVSAMQPIGARSGIALAISPAAGLPALLADRRGLRQIILNVLSNALRFTPPGGRIELGTRLSGDGTIELAVADTGQGMSDADLARARGEPSTGAAPARIRLAGTAGGTGYGLPIVRDLVGAHGGSVAIDSVPGHGTTVTVTFPADLVLLP